MIFWLVLKLEISYRVIYLEALHDEIFEFPCFFFCLKIRPPKIWQTSILSLLA